MLHGLKPLAQDLPAPQGHARSGLAKHFTSALPWCQSRQESIQISASGALRWQIQAVGLSGIGCVAMKSSRNRRTYDSSNSWMRSAFGDLNTNPA
jgi:hypothetical protein